MESNIKNPIFYTARRDHYVSTRFSDESVTIVNGNITQFTFHTTPRELSEERFWPLMEKMPLLSFATYMCSLYRKDEKHKRPAVMAVCMNRMNVEMAELDNVGEDMGIDENPDFPLQVHVSGDMVTLALYAIGARVDSFSATKIVGRG